jgi:hypothetical protein
MQTELEITLLPAADDSYYLTPAYQEELRHFEQALRADNLPIAAKPALAKMSGGPFLSGEFVLELTDKIGPPLIAGIAGWLHGRSGRKVRLKVADIEVEAPTMKEVKELVALVPQIQQRQAAGGDRRAVILP